MIFVTNTICSAPNTPPPLSFFFYQSHSMPTLHSLDHPNHVITLNPAAKVQIKTEQIQDISNIIDTCQEGDVIFIGIDNTIQTISSYLFQTNSLDLLSQGGRLIESSETLLDENHTAFISRWRLSRRIQLVHPDWPLLIQKAQKKGALVYGLTQIGTGACGVMSRVEEWRYNELYQLGIHFTPTYLNKEDCPLSECAPMESQPASGPIFYKGIFFTGSLFTEKSIVLDLFLKHHTPRRIIMIDDRIGQIQSAQDVPFSGAFLGIYFRGVDLAVRPPVSETQLAEIKNIQHIHLTQGIWLENEEALTILDMNTHCD
jgi:hypothetical protein